MANKSRILYLLHFLQENSDEEHPVSTAEIRAALKERGCPVLVETLRDDIAALREAGYDIVVNESSGQSTTYSYVDRELDVPELQILMDAVSSSQFISQTRSRQIITKLTAMAGPSYRANLRPGIMTSDTIKTPNSQLLYTVQTIQQAIQANLKISFQYYRFNLDRERVPRHGGKWYVISPYVTIWKQERYFLVGWSDEREKVVIFRIDRMGLPKLTQEARVPAPESFDVRDYTERIFNMYDAGVMENVTLRCRHHMMDHIVDYFGKGVEPFNITEEGFDVNVTVCASSTFFSWVMRYAGSMTIAGPAQIREMYRAILQRAMDGVMESCTESGAIDPERIDGKGQPVRLYVDGNRTVRVNGTEPFLSGGRQGEFRAKPSVPEVDGLRGRRQGETFKLYPEAFALELRLPDGRRSLNYHVIIDGSVEPLSWYCPDGQREFVLEMPKTPIEFHSIQIVEWATERLAFRFDYAILPGLRFDLERRLLYDDCTPTMVRLCYDGCDLSERVYPPEETDWAALSTAHLRYDLEIRLPIVRGTLQAQNIFALPSTIWWENIAESTFVRLQCPPDWSGRLFLGESAVPQNAADGSFGLGNFIKMHKNREACEALTLVMRNAQGHQATRELTRIAFEEHFTESPVFIEDGMLTWRPVGRYVGGDRDEFQLILDVPGEESPFSYSLNVKSSVFDRLFVRDYPCGEFPFRIIKKSRGLFGAGSDRVLFEGTLTTGAPEQ